MLSFVTTPQKGGCPHFIQRVEEERLHSRTFLLFCKVDSTGNTLLSLAERHCTGVRCIPHREPLQQMGQPRGTRDSPGVRTL